MNNKETLIRLIQESVNGCAENWARQIAEYLLDHGTYLPNLMPIHIISEERLTNAEILNQWFQPTESIHGQNVFNSIPSIDEIYTALSEIYNKLGDYENLAEDGLLFAFKPIDTSEILEK